MRCCLRLGVNEARYFPVSSLPIQRRRLTEIASYQVPEPWSRSRRAGKLQGPGHRVFDELRRNREEIRDIGS